MLGIRWMPQPVHASKVYSDLALRPGDFSPAGVGSEDWAAASDEFIAPPVSATALWAASGGGGGASAFVVPRSHLSGRGPGAADAAEAVEVSLSPGSLLLLDGRTWFAEARGRGLTVRNDYCGPQFRTEENQVLATTDEALEAMPHEAKEQLGYKTWFGYGGTFGRSGPGITAGPRSLINGPA